MRRWWMACVLCMAAGLYGADQRAAQIFVQVRPEADLAQIGETSVLLKIRLAHGTQARVWAADTCTEPQPNAYVVAQSGAYTIPLSMLGSEGAKRVCLSSSDGSLTASLTVATSQR